MASFAHVTGIDMVWRFASCSGAVVTLNAGLPHNIAVVELGRPIGSIVTGVAGLCRAQVIGTLPYGDDVVVALGAGSIDLRVVDLNDFSPPFIAMA